MSFLQDLGERIGLPQHMKIMAKDPENLSNGEKLEEKDIYTVLVNPKSYKVTHKMEHAKDQSFSSLKPTFRFNKMAAKGFDLELLFDSTGSLGTAPIYRQTVFEQANRFLEMTYPRKKDKCDKLKTQPLFIVWGEMTFKGVLKSVDISYSHFDSTGNPIRAKAKCTFEGDSSFKLTKPKDLFNFPEEDRDFNRETHALNAVLKAVSGGYAGVVTLLSDTPERNLPKSMRLLNEVLKII
ncbi:MAG: hypothetical protein AAFO69_02595 [Bacteroidota bacterium]